VAYLDGSKVLTTGSALTFDGTSLGVGGVPTIQGELNVFKTGAAPTLYVQGDTGNSTTQGIIRIGGASARSASIQGFREASSNAHALRFYSYNAADLLSYEIASTGAQTWYVGGTRSMDLTSTGLGIGTSSPSQKLQLSASSPTLNLDSTNRTWWVGSIETGASDANFQVGTGLNRNSTLLTMTPPGNLGLGVTPSAWGSDYRAVDAASGANGGGAFSGFFSTSISRNCYNDNTNWRAKYSADERPALYAQPYGGGHQWFNGNAFVTAGGTVSMTQAMTLDASGNLLVGTTSTSYSAANRTVLAIGGGSNGSLIDFQISGTSSDGYIYHDGTNITFENSVAGYIRFGTNAAERARITSAGDVGIGTSSPASKLSVVNASSVQIQASTGTIDFRVQSIDANSAAYAGTVSNHALVFTTNNFERARITSGGDLLVGTTSNASGSPKIAVNGSIQPLWGQFRVATVFDDSYRQGLYFDSTNRNMTVFSTTNDTGGNIIFSTRVGAGSSDADYGTERARITSGGYFKASNTGTYQSSTSTYHELRNDANANTVRISNTIASGYTDAVAQIAITGYSPNTTNSWFLFCNDSTATRAEIRSNGGIANYQGNDVNLSDRREKTNFAPAKSYLDTICAIPVQTFNYIDQSEDDPGLTLGVVAQDVQAVAPELVMESDWGTKDDPKMRLSIYQTDLQYALMKCIQELKAELDSVKAELATLKGK
jgi:hypothetical protein